MRRPRLSRVLGRLRRIVARVAHGPRGRWRIPKVTPLPADIDHGVPQLPLDVWESILGYLWNDHRTLAACALTCRAFHPIVRHHVFNTVHLTHAPGYSEYSRFTKLLQDSPHVALSVRALHLSLDSALERATLPAVLPRLHEIESLTLNFGGGMFEMDEDTREKLPTYFRLVKHLRIENVRFDGTDLLRVLCACPELRGLTLCAVRWRRSSLLPAFTPDLAAVVPPRQVELDELTLRSPPPQVVAWLVKGPFRLALRNLELMWDGGSDAKYVPSLFRAGGQSLQHLSLAFPGWFSFRDAVDLSNNTRLRTLHLSHIRIDGSQPRLLYIPDPVPLKTYEWVPAALSRLHSLHLTQIHFSIELVKGGDLSVLDWDAIDAHLARLAREAGGLVTTFHVGNAEYSGRRCNAVDAVMYRLPRLREVEGRVGVVYTHWPKVEECWFP
ncbi:uncharacterized protein C8Q71DRAFT_855958 [Rhodofomes roseus]|uniref:F-box domain-containing protein n=1 Tax=Rhodofomes roseus TaxID=34475 RepID=A0ABQ8KML4_9APHY|nr:uncharacterized protein C8Q71DRAFT_855958 [Rhodofomes roseus]KAH9839333.1 hypothetical protein C8Q71DRAFT_855958 [Rhodofomes roseus]